MIVETFAYNAACFAGMFDFDNRVSYGCVILTKVC